MDFIRECAVGAVANSLSFTGHRSRHVELGEIISESLADGECIHGFLELGYGERWSSSRDDAWCRCSIWRRCLRLLVCDWLRCARRVTLAPLESRLRFGELRLNRRKMPSPAVSCRRAGNGT